MSDPHSAKIILVFIKHPKKLKYLRFLADAGAKKNKQRAARFGMCSAIMEPALTFYKSFSALACVSAVLLPRRQLFRKLCAR